MSMLENIQKMREKILDGISSASSVTEIEQIHQTYLGRKGELNQISKSMTSIPVEERKVVGAAVNEVKDEVTTALEQRRFELLDLEPAIAPALDTTLPGVT